MIIFRQFYGGIPNSSLGHTEEAGEIVEVEKLNDMIKLGQDHDGVDWCGNMFNMETGEQICENSGPYKLPPWTKDKLLVSIRLEQFKKEHK